MRPRYAAAVSWFRRAADQGNADAQFNLGSMYATGQGVRRDQKAAVRWYRMAADQGRANAQFNLALIYDNGEGVARDDVAAASWFRRQLIRVTPRLNRISASCMRTVGECRRTKQPRRAGIKRLPAMAMSAQKAGECRQTM